MTDTLSAVEMAASGMRSQSVRLRHISENIANADTPGYRRKLVSFEPDRDPGAVPGARVEVDRRTGKVSVHAPELDEAGEKIGITLTRERR